MKGGFGSNALLVFHTIFRSLYLFLANKYLKIIMVPLRQDLFRKMLKQDVRNFNSVNTGIYMAYLLNNLQNLETNYYSAVLNFIFMTANLLGAFISMVLIDFSTVYMILALMVISAVIPRLAANYVKKKSESYIKDLDIYTSRLKGLLEGFILIRSFQELENERMSQLNSSKPIKARFEEILAGNNTSETGAEMTDMGDIRLEHMCFSYDRENSVLNDVSFITGFLPG